MRRHKILTKVDISKALTDLADWDVEDGELKAVFKLGNYSSAIAFITQVGFLAEKYNHHPDFCSSYYTVTFKYCTHDVGNKITDIDIKLAEEISRIAKRHYV